MSESANLATFLPCVGTTFHAEPLDGATSELELVEAKALPSHPGAPRQEPFCLLFRAPPGSGLWQGPVTVAHEQAGTVDLFLMPTGEDEAGTYFEAVFN